MQDPSSEYSLITARRQRFPSRFVVMNSNADLPQIVRALRPACRLTRRLHRRQQQCDQYADDGNHDEQLDQREPFRTWFKTVGDCPDFAQSAEQNGTVPFSETVLKQPISLVLQGSILRNNE